MNVVRWGIIGAGEIVRKRVAAAIRNCENSELVSISRGRADLAEAAAAEVGARKWFADWRTQIADPEIDAVYVATPVFLHAEQTIAAAAAGKHVLCEKPMALNVAECDSMIAACEANNVKLGIAYYRHFYPVIERAKEIIAAGEIGRAALAQINAFEHIDMQSGDPRHWFVEKEKSGGGPMMDFGCHRLEVLVNLFGDVDAVAGMFSGSVYEREIEDTAVATLHFGSGVTATVSVTHATNIPKDTLQIFGTNGCIDIPVLNSGRFIVTSGMDQREENLPPAENIHQPLIEDFVDSVLHNRVPAVDGRAGAYVSQLLEKIYDEK
ncbi:MAG: gfo/Idh/MocA family oxidoreductase [Acidobacteria bacterium]|nr:MAG: gfo/Idh/MocA family oxidoreductase [Acidobacteriota bacterium]